MPTCSVCGGAMAHNTQREGCDYHAMPDDCVDGLKARIATLEAALRPFAEDGRDVCDPGRDDGADTAIVFVSALRAAMEAMEGRDGNENPSA